VSRGRLSQLSLILLLLAAAPRAGASALEPLLGIRIRQEILPNAYWFDPKEGDRNWIRYRSRVGLRARAGEEHAFELRFAHEFRKIYEPDTKVDTDEMVVDHLFWSWKRAGSGGFALTIGRQDIAWDGGFLVMDGTPLDGSRTQYQDAVRLEIPRARGTWDLALLWNSKRDDFVVAGEEKRALREADERAVAVRFVAPSGAEASLIGMGEEDPDHRSPDRTTWTLGLRRAAKQGETLRWLVEGALQRQASASGAGFAWAGNASRQGKLGEKTTGSIGFFYYSGAASDDLAAFRSPYGRWPKWSELCVYTLIGEGGVAEWQNLASPVFTIRHTPVDRVALRGSLLVPFAPEPDWNERGLLTVLEVQGKIARGLTAQVLWEWQINGSYPKEMTEDAHFIRWQVSYDLP
jgi:hypothetical protein